MPLPLIDFDPTESAVTWKTLKENGIETVFATPDGKIASADIRMLKGQGLGPWKKLLIADENAQVAYAQMSSDKAFKSPITWKQATSEHAALVLPGGHAPGMKVYLESEVLQALTTQFFREKKTVGAICHGVVLAARSKDGDKSVLYGRKTTALLKSQEMTAWWMTSAWLGSYYRTYPVTVEDEVKGALASPKDFLKGRTPIQRDSPENLKPGFVVEDRNYISARWPGDAHTFANALVKKLKTN